jgi:hypothetical protein
MIYQDLKATSSWNQGQINMGLEVGGPSRQWSIQTPLKEGEEATLILRWRRFPLTRELLLRARDGTEFTLAADVRTPWEKMDIEGSIKIMEPKGVKVLSAQMTNDAEVTSEKAMGFGISPISQDIWSKARGQERPE